GRKRPLRSGVRSAKEPHLANAVAQLGRREEPPDQRIDRQRQQQVEEQRARQAAGDEAGRGRLSAHELEQQLAEEIQAGHDGGRHERRMKAVAGGRLPVAPDPEAADREQQRGEPERAERRRVEQEAGEKARDRAEHRAAQQRDRQQGDEHDARGAERAVLGQHRELEERRDEENDAGLQTGHYREAFGTRTITERTDEKSTSGRTWMLLNRFASLSLSLVTVPIGIPCGYFDLSGPAPSVPAVMTVSP